jgi:hypothetical protein
MLSNVTCSKSGAWSFFRSEDAQSLTRRGFEVTSLRRRDSTTIR